MKAAAAALCLLSSACVLPVVSAGNYLPAGDLQPGDVHVSASLEAARVLAGPSDSASPTNPAPIPLDAKQYEVSTWVASDISVRWQIARRVTLEGQLKLTNPVTPFVPNLVGGSLGVRVRLLEHAPEGGFAAEIGARLVGIAAEQRLDRTAGDLQQTDFWDYRAGGLELPLILTYRINSLMAVTASPFLRAYYIRTWHTVESAGERTQDVLPWTPILSGGFAASFAFDVGSLELAPGMALELATRPGNGVSTHVLFEPGLSVGMRL